MPTFAPLVLGYGALAEEREGVPCVLRGFRRTWGVAMDNRRTIPGYKYYLDARTGERPAIYVAYLDIERDDAAHVNAIAFPATDLEYLDRRERSYRRVDVSDHLDLDGPVYAFRGRPEARERLARGRRENTAVIARHYLDHVRAGFERHGQLDEFEATTEPLDLPIRDLRRIDLTPA